MVRDRTIFSGLGYSAPFCEFLVFFVDKLLALDIMLEIMLSILNFNFFIDDSLQNKITVKS